MWSRLSGERGPPVANRKTYGLLLAFSSALLECLPHPLPIMAGCGRHSLLSGALPLPGYQYERTVAEFRGRHAPNQCPPPVLRSPVPGKIAGAGSLCSGTLCIASFAAIHDTLTSRQHPGPNGRVKRVIINGIVQTVLLPAHALFSLPDTRSVPMAKEDGAGTAA